MNQEGLASRGSVSVLGRADWTYQGVDARLSDGGLHILRLDQYRSQVAADGPHFHFQCIQAPMLLAAMQHTGQAHLEYLYFGPFLGSLQSVSGYQATNVGTQEFPIVQLALQLAIAHGETSFVLTGRCAPGLPRTFPGIQVDGWTPVFEIAFVLRDDELAEFFNQTISAERFVQCRDQCIASPAPI